MSVFFLCGLINPEGRSRCYCLYGNSGRKPISMLMHCTGLSRCSQFNCSRSPILALGLWFWQTRHQPYRNFCSNIWKDLYKYCADRHLLVVRNELLSNLTDVWWSREDHYLLLLFFSYFQSVTSTDDSYEVHRYFLISRRLVKFCGAWLQG